MARSPLMRSLERALATVAAADERSGETDERRVARTTRRELIRRAGLLGAGTLLFGGLTQGAAGARREKRADLRVVVVGGGLAGLTAAYKLKGRGVRASVIEGNTRLGGRCWSGRGLFEDGQIIEHGGELIDSEHRAIRGLASALGLDLDDVLAAEPAGTDTLYYFGGRPYSLEEVTRDWQAVYPALQEDATAAGYPTTYYSFTDAGRALDALSLRDWINTRVPGGVGSRFGQLLDIAYNIEYGAETSDQSSLNLVNLISDSERRPFEIFGASDERFKVRGGNDQIVRRLGEELDGQIQTGMKLTAIRLNGDSTYTLTVQSGLASRRIVADHVVLALPFSILRSQVDFSQAGFSQLKANAISRLGMGSNTKLHLQFRKRHWVGLGCDGATYADTGLQTTWEVTRAQRGDKGILVDYTGGPLASSFVGADPQQRAVQFLQQLEPVLPGITQKWNGRATIDAWAGNAWSLGAYSYWRVGQYTTIAGAEGQRSANCHFAGEHTSINSQGYLNGAVETGVTAAEEILADLGNASA